MSIGLFWSTPITNRTANDVSNAYELIRRAKAGNADISQASKGCLNASDLNRIESNTYILATSLGLDVICKEWEDYFPNQPTTDDKTRILANAQAIADKLYTDYEYVCTTLPGDLTSYTHLNALEQCLLDASNYIFKPLRTTSSDILVTADGETPMTVADYESSFTQLGGVMVVSRSIYNQMEHDSNTEYIVVGNNEVREYLGDTPISR